MTATGGSTVTRISLRTAALAAALVLTAGARAEAHFVLYFEGQPGSYVEDGIKRFTDTDGLLSASGSPGTGVHLSFNSPNWDNWFYFDFAAPAGMDLVPGEYLGATRAAFAAPGTPGLDVYGNGEGCNTIAGSFVVHEARFGPSGPVAFSADFEQHCEGTFPALHGSVRFDAGDAACAGAPPDAPCDDDDACTSGDRCIAGSCTGSFVEPTSCAPSTAPCIGASACSPLTGECAPGQPLSATPCDDGNACTSDDACQDGACVGVETRSCDDNDPCTLDACGKTDCTHTTIDGCWSLAGTARVTACAEGRCLHQDSSVKAVIVIAPDGRFAKPNGRCPTTGTLLPVEVGSWKRKRDGRLTLATTNLGDVLRAFTFCPDIDRDLIKVLQKGRRTYRQTYEVLEAGDRPFCRWARGLPADGRHICGQQTVHATLVVRGIAVSVGVRWRLTGQATTP
jgi:hypothetical protein